MIKKISTSAKLYILVVVLCVFITGIGLYAIREMKSMKQNTQTLLADRIVPLQQLTNIRYLYTTNILALTGQLENHSITTGEAITQINNGGKAIDDNWQAYLQTYLTPDEQQLVQQTIPLKEKADKVVAELKQKIENTNVNFSGDSIVIKTAAAINPLISKLNELVQLQIKASGQLKESNDQLYASTAEKIYWLIVISLLFAGALAFLIINDNRVLINDLKTSSRKIKEEEAKVSAFIKYAGDAIFISDEDLRIVDVNDSAINLVGYSKDELLTMRIPDIMAPEEQESHSIKLETIKKEGGSIHERKIKRKDGGVVDTEVNVQLLKGTGYIAVMRDISERKKAELKIMERESQLTAFFENVEGAASLLDAEKKYVLFNSRFIYDHRLLTKQDPYVGQEVYQHFPEEIRKSRLKLLDNVLKGNKEVVDVDYVRDGHRVCYRTSFSPVIMNGKVTGISTYSIDLTKSKEAEIKIRENEEKFRMAFMTSPDAFYIGTLNSGKIIDVNEGFHNLFGYTREEAIGKTSLELNIYSDNDDRAKLFEGLRTDGRVKDLELIMRKKTGEVVMVSISANTSGMNNERIILAVIRDITERKRAQELFRQSQEEFRVMFEGAAIGAALVGPEGIPIRCNPALCRMLGYTESELTRIAFTEFTHPEDVDKDLKLFQSLIKDEIDHYQIEKRYIRKDGRIIWGFLTVSLVKVQDGSLRYAVGMVEDITERKRTESIIKEQAETFMAIIENAKESIWLLSPDLKVLQFNKTGKDKLRLNRGKEIYTGANFKEFLYMGTEDIFMSMFNDALAGKYTEQESCQQNIHGETFWLRTKMYPVYDTSKRLMGIAVLSETITDRKRSENELKDSEEKFRRLVEDTLVGVFILQDEKIVYVNPGFESICGYTRKELLNGMNFQQLIYNEDVNRVKNNDELRISGEMPTDEYLLRATKKDGSIIYVDVIVSGIVYNNKPAVIGSVIDRTHQVEEEKRISRAVTDAQEQERTQIGMELHDNVKQLMAASLMSLDLAKSRIINKENGAIEFIDNVRVYITESIKELRRLSHQLAPAVDDGKGTLVEKIEKLVNDAKISDEMEVLIDIYEFNKPISAEMQLAFYRVIQEQFNNIIKYSKAHKVLISVHGENGILNLAIKDDGIGFDTTTKKEGIGLENIRRRINMLNGEATIISSPGEGCEVRVSVPFS